MENKYLKKDMQDSKYVELAEYCNSNNLVIDSDDNYYYILKPEEKLVDGEIIDNSIEYELLNSYENAKYNIIKFKEQLNSSDYKVIKCQEYSLANKPLPYNIILLNTERDNLRNKINELEIIVKNYELTRTNK